MVEQYFAFFFFQEGMEKGVGKEEGIWNEKRGEEGWKKKQLIHTHAHEHTRTHSEMEGKGSH